MSNWLVLLECWRCPRILAISESFPLRNTNPAENTGGVKQQQQLFSVPVHVSVLNLNWAKSTALRHLNAVHGHPVHQCSQALASLRAIRSKISIYILWSSYKLNLFSDSKANIGSDVSPDAARWSLLAMNSKRVAFEDNGVNLCTGAAWRESLPLLLNYSDKQKKTVKDLSFRGASKVM